MLHARRVYQEVVMNRMWRKAAIVLIIFTLSFSITYGQGNTKSFLWKIDTPNGASYLLGSVHFLKQEHYPLNPAIENAYTQTDVLAVEANLSGPNAMAVSAKMLQAGIYQDEQTLKGNLSTKTYDLLLKKLEENSMTVDSLQKFKPWMVGMTILSMELMKLSFKPEFGIDMYFLNKATEDKKTIVELEGAEFQLNLFNSFSKEEDESFLLSTILEISQLKTQMDDMIDAWVKGDAAGLQKMMTGHVKKAPQLKDIYKKINDDRNVGMVKKIETYLNSGKHHLVVVGAAHLVGPNGILQLLKNKGFTVTQQ